MMVKREIGRVESAIASAPLATIGIYRTPTGADIRLHFDPPICGQHRTKVQVATVLAAGYVNAVLQGEVSLYQAIEMLELMESPLVGVLAADRHIKEIRCSLPSHLEQIYANASLADRLWLCHAIQHARQSQTDASNAVRDTHRAWLRLLGWDGEELDSVQSSEGNESVQPT